MPLQITIDGTSGVGKSTLSKALASSLGYLFLNTGLIFRGLAWYFIKNKVKCEDIARALEEIETSGNFYFDKNQWFLNKTAIAENELIRPEISLHTSQISQYPLVREYVLKIERRVAEKNNIVIEGRDIGTAVFPNALLKIYLTASEEIRTQRRYKELKAKGILGSKTLEEIQREIALRDKEDKTREIAPLVKPKDAIVLDSGNKSVDELVKEIKELLDKRLATQQIPQEH